MTLLAVKIPNRIDHIETEEKAQSLPKKTFNVVSMKTKLDNGDVPYTTWTQWRKMPENKGKSILEFHKLFWEEPIKNGDTQADMRKKDANYVFRLHEFCKKHDLDKNIYLPPSKTRNHVHEKDYLIEGLSNEVLYAAYLYVARNLEKVKNFNHSLTK